MGFITSLIEQRAHPGQDINWAKYFGLKDSPSGAHVDQQTSLQQSAVFACVRVLAETEAMLPLILYKRLPRGKERATNHRLYPILHDLPNPEMTSMELRETLMGHVGLWGNGYAEIEYAQGGWIKGLWPLRPDKMKIIRRAGQLLYIYQMPGGSDVPYVELPKARIFHIRGLGFDGLVGYDPIGQARNAIGLALAAEEFGARLFGNGTQLGVTYEHPGKLSEEAYTRLQKSIEKRHSGLTNAHRLMILEEGMKASQVGIQPDNAQFLETRKFQNEEIARFYRMQQHKIGLLENATFSNIEHQGIEFVTDTMQPWLTRWEQAIYRDLLTPTERADYYAEHLVDALLRGDTVSRYEAYNIGRNGGWLSANDIRERENMNPVDGGDVYLVPLNMVPADQVTGEPQGSGGAGEQGRTLADGEVEQRARRIEQRAQDLAKSRQKLIRAYERVVKDAVQRVLKREIADVRRAAEKYLTKRDAFQFSTWLKQFYAEHKSFWIRQMLPILLSYADQVGLDVAGELETEAYSSDDINAFIEDYVRALADREAGSSQLQLQALLDEALIAGTDPGELVTARLDAWEEKRTDKVTRREKNMAFNAFLVAFYVLSGITKKRWVTIGDSCPYCRSLNGKVVEVQKFFVEKDTDFKPDGADKPLNVRFSMGHGPAHGGCNCTIVAERE